MRSDKEIELVDKTTSVDSFIAGHKKEIYEESKLRRLRDILEIRNSLIKDTRYTQHLSVRELAFMFGMSKSNVEFVLQRKPKESALVGDIFKDSKTKNMKNCSVCGTVIIRTNQNDFQWEIKKYCKNPSCK